MPNSAELSAAVISHLADAYPRNHNYRVMRGKLKPSWRLKRRYKRISALYPRQLNSFCDIGSCKGYFCIQAALRGADTLGIDVDEADLTASRAVAEYFGLPNIRFAYKTLTELASEGGAFDVVQVINTYHYLYFGSGRAEACAQDHDALFKLLHSVITSGGRLIFSNCEDPKRLPSGARATPAALADYNPQAIRRAASRYFTIQKQRALGTRPLWVGIRNGC